MRNFHQLSARKISYDFSYLYIDERVLCVCKSLQIALVPRKPLLSRISIASEYNPRSDQFSGFNRLINFRVPLLCRYLLTDRMQEN